MLAPMHAQNFSMSFTSFSSGSAPANLNSSSKGYQFVSTAPIVHHNKHEMEAVQLMSRTRKELLKTPSMNGLMLFFFLTIHPETATLFLLLGLLLQQQRWMDDLFSAWFCYCRIIPVEKPAALLLTSYNSLKLSSRSIYLHTDILRFFGSTIIWKIWWSLFFCGERDCSTWKSSKIP